MPQQDGKQLTREDEEQQHGERMFILMALFKEGPLSLEELENRTFLFVSQFESFVGSMLHPLHPEAHHRRRDKIHGEKFDAKTGCDLLVSEKLAALNQDNKYELTQDGRKEAARSSAGLQNLANRMEQSTLDPSVVARNTVVVDFFLAAIKLSTGFLSGSLGLIADGADATVDTATASTIWIGTKIKQELLGTLIILSMMVVTAFSVGYESTVRIMEAMIAPMSPISMPYLVIVAEAISLVVAVVLAVYQRVAGRRHGSLALISQSIDSKNHVYVAGAVIIGAVLSIFGVYLVDALLGALVALRILADAIGLSGEVMSSVKGEGTDFSKYEMSLEKHWRLAKMDTYRNWVLYSINEDGLSERDEIVDSLERTFGSKYVPILSDFKLDSRGEFSFGRDFDDLIKPLLDKGLLVQEGGELTLTEQGKRYVERTSRSMRYHRNQ